MFRNKLLLSLLLSLLAPGLAEAKVNVRKLYQFPNDVFHDIDNVAIRPNGHLLLNTITEPVVYTLNPRAAAPTATPLQQFDGATRLAGITEVSPDVFAMVLDLTSGTPVVSEITSIPDGQTLNGMTTASENVVLVADSPVGTVYSANSNIGAYQVAIQDTQFQPPPGSPFHLGINGIHRADGTLYFTKSGLNTFGKAPINAQGTAARSPSIIATAPANNFYCNFALDAGGNPRITLHLHALDIVRLPSGMDSIALNSAEVVHPTACIFGNSRDTKGTLYVVTAGEETDSQIINGHVFAITV
ncbi:hypothetical protein BJX65DRAFT_309104 [Aspergillus insuetus]